MPQSNGDRSAPGEPSRNKLPYKDHPIFKLRKLLIIVAIIGIVLALCAAGPYVDAPYVTSMFFLVISIFFAMADLTQYALRKVQNPDEEPEWPKRRYMVFDCILAVCLFFVFCEAASAAEYRYSYHPVVISAYSALCDLFCSFMHAYSFWKQLIARYKAKWLKTLQPAPCARCGYLESTTPDLEYSPPPCGHPPNTFPYAGPSAAFPKARPVTPQASDAMMEEGLLIGSEFGSSSTNSYGTIDTPDMTIDQDEQVVVAKGKGKGKKKEKSSTKE